MASLIEKLVAFKQRLKIASDAELEVMVAEDTIVRSYVVEEIARRNRMRHHASLEPR